MANAPFYPNILSSIKTTAFACTSQFTLHNISIMIKDSHTTTSVTPRSANAKAKTTHHKIKVINFKEYSLCLKEKN
ncbi:hypothetical protein JTE90_016848 [Oedothorax gibbosus]|uniref:Uncharacterized protein n=1 Tax=Oedothorax gibbosus TaxID=931172 RepID=A0AAV6VWN6_9ARAC|nr:hypothetical protein JTE90_016848 [Oedothorax gibbosus]